MHGFKLLFASALSYALLTTFTIVFLDSGNRECEQSCTSPGKTLRNTRTQLPGLAGRATQRPRAGSRGLHWLQQQTGSACLKGKGTGRHQSESMSCAIGCFWHGRADGRDGIRASSNWRPSICPCQLQTLSKWRWHACVTYPKPKSSCVSTYAVSRQLSCQILTGRIDQLARHANFFVEDSVLLF